MESEKARILENGGIVEAFEDYDGTFIGPLRVWAAKQDVPGLAMTRSMGDEIAHSVGCSPVPEIIEFQVTKKDKFAVIASDGVWEFLSNDDVAKIVAQEL